MIKENSSYEKCQRLAYKMLDTDDCSIAKRLYDEMQSAGIDCVFVRWCRRTYKVSYNPEDGCMWAATRDFDDDDIITFRVNKMT